MEPDHRYDLLPGDKHQGQALIADGKQRRLTTLAAGQEHTSRVGPALRQAKTAQSQLRKAA